jgi:hypothetical protein
MSMFRSTWPFMLAAAIVVSVATGAQAHGPMSVELNGARIVKLDSPATDIIIGNPGIADVTVQAPNRLVIIGKQAGVTRLIVMSDGVVSIDTQIVVSAKSFGGQVSVFAPDGGNITESRYACGERCTQVTGTGRSGGGGGGGAPAGGGGQAPAIPLEPTVDQVPPGNPGDGPGPSY